MTAEFDEACDLAGPDDRVGDQEIAHARFCHQLGLTQLGAREADGAGSDLTRTDAPAAMALDVGSPGDSGRSARLGNEADVVVHHVEVDAQRRSVQIVLRAAEQRRVPRRRHESAMVRSGVEGDQDAKPGLPGTRPSQNARSPSCPSSLVRRSAIRRAVSGPSGRSSTSRFACRAARGPAVRSSPTIGRRVRLARSAVTSWTSPILRAVAASKRSPVTK